MKLTVYFITCAKSGDESLSGYNLTKPIKLSFLSQIQFFYLDSQTCKLKKWLIIKILELVAFWFQISEASGTRIFLGFRKGKIKSIESHCAKYEENLSPLTRSARRSGKADFRYNYYDTHTGPVLQRLGWSILKESIWTHRIRCAGSGGSQHCQIHNLNDKQLYIIKTHHSDG